MVIHIFYVILVYKLNHFNKIKWTLLNIPDDYWFTG